MASSPEFFAHRIERLVYLLLPRRGAAEEVALGGFGGWSEVMGADADQAERATVGLAHEQRLGRAEHLVRRLGGSAEAASPGEGCGSRRSSA